MSKATRRIDYWHDPAAPKPTSRKTSVRQPINICLRARLIGGQITPEPSEAAEVRWIDAAHLADYPIHPALRHRIDHGLNSTEPYVS